MQQIIVHPCCYDPSACPKSTCLMPIALKIEVYLVSVCETHSPVDHDIPNFQKLVVPHDHVPRLKCS